MRPETRVPRLSARPAARVFSGERRPVARVHASGRLRKNKRVASSCPSFDSVHRAERAEALMKGIRTILSGASGAGVNLLEERGSHTLSSNRISQNEIYFASRATRAEDRPLRSGIGSLVCVDPYGLTWFRSGRRSSNFCGGKSRFGNKLVEDPLGTRALANKSRGHRDD